MLCLPGTWDSPLLIVGRRRLWTSYWECWPPVGPQFPWRLAHLYTPEARGPFLAQGRAGDPTPQRRCPIGLWPRRGAPEGKMEMRKIVAVCVDFLVCLKQVWIHLKKIKTKFLSLVNNFRGWWMDLLPGCRVRWRPRVGKGRRPGKT